MSERQRTGRIVRTSVIGIAANIALSAMKAVIGLSTGGVAFVSDAVNNLTDALSSVITLIGAKLAAKRPDREHPLGHGRIENISSIAISALVVYAGISAGMESVHQIMSPVPPEYDPLSLSLVAVGIAVKVLLSVHFLHVGREVESPALIDSGTDARMDVIISSATLVAALAYGFTGVDAGPWLALAISAFIVWTGVGMIQDTVSELIGRRVPSEVTQSVRESIESFDEVFGAYDLLLHAYGPTTYVASAHIEVSSSMSVGELSELERRIAEHVAAETGVMVVALGTYSHAEDEGAARLRERAYGTALAFAGVIQAHGFSVDEKARILRFDIVVEFGLDSARLCESVTEAVQEACPGYSAEILVDADLSDL